MNKESLAFIVGELAEISKIHGADKMDKILDCINDVHAVAEKYGKETFTAALETVISISKKGQ